MKVYHGSKANFDHFSYDYIRTNGTSEGIGFYFTDSKQIARGYAENGYLYTVYFQGKKPLSHNKKVITKTQLKKFLKALDQRHEHLSNYGDIEWEGYQKVLNKAVELEYNSSTNDVDMIAGISNACGSPETCMYTLYEVLGYDSIILDAEWGLDEENVPQKLYIALVNDAITILEVEQV